jgi:hypothetical protein
MDDGHCGLPVDELTALTGKLLDVAEPLIETALTLELEASPSYSPYQPAAPILRIDNQYVRAPPLLARPRFRPYLGGVEG